MASKEVRIVVSAKDEATQVFKRLGIEVQSTTKRLDKFAKNTQRAGRYLLTHFTLPLALAAGRFVKAASDFTETSSKFDAAFGDMADSSREFANQLARDMNRSRVQMQNFMADTMAMAKPILENAKAADTLSRAISALAVDLGSFFNAADTDALQALHSGLVGMTTPLRRYGIVLLDATIQQEAYRLGLQKTTKDMSEAEKMALRFVQILRQTKDAQGDAILTGASFENQLKALKSSFADLSVEIGQELMPYALAAVKWARDMIEAFRSLDPETRQTIIQFAGIVAIAGPLTLALSSIVKGIVLTGKALYSVAKFAANHPYVFLATVAAALAMQIDAVQAAIERLMRSLGLGVIYDTIDAFEELSEAASGIVFDPDTAGADAMKKYYEQWQKEIEEMLKSGLFTGAGTGKTIGDQLRKELKQTLLWLGQEITSDDLRQRIYAIEGETLDAILQDITEHGDEYAKEIANAFNSFNQKYKRDYNEFMVGIISGNDKALTTIESLKNVIGLLEELWISTYGSSDLSKEIIPAMIANLKQTIANMESEIGFSGYFRIGFQDALKSMQDWSKNVQQLAQDTAQAMQQAFSDFFFDLFTLELKSLGDYLNAFFRSVARALANYMSASFMGFLFPGTIPGRAAGGPVYAGQPYIVGERGPELFIPNNSGRIVSNSSLGAPDVTVNLINQSGQPIRQVERKTSFDGRRIIVDLIYSAAEDNIGGFGDFLRGRA